MLLLWSIGLALMGLGCFVLPPYLFRGMRENAVYGHPLIPWFAFAFSNLHVVPTLFSFFVLGVAAGVAHPRRWLLLGCLSVSLPPSLNAINLIRDLSIDPTSHNLFPFEFAMLAIVSWPALVGAYVGGKIGLKIGDRGTYGVRVQ